MQSIEPKIIDTQKNEKQSEILFKKDEITNDDTFRKEIHDAYNKMSVWSKNLFQVPKGSIGKSFINELTSTLDLWNNYSPYRDVALKMFMILPSLLLQRTSKKSKTIENKNQNFLIKLYLTLSNMPMILQYQDLARLILFSKT